MNRSEKVVAVWLVILFFVAPCVLAWPWLSTPLKAPEAPAWAQAVSSFLAIIGSVLLVQWQHRSAARLEAERRGHELRSRIGPIVAIVDQAGFAIRTATNWAALPDDAAMLWLAKPINEDFLEECERALFAVPLHEMGSRESAEQLSYFRQQFRVMRHNTQVAQGILFRGGDDWKREKVSMDQSRRNLKEMDTKFRRYAMALGADDGHS